MQVVEEAVENQGKSPRVIVSHTMN